MFIWLLLGTLLVVAGLVFSRRIRRTAKQVPRSKPVTSAFHAVEIIGHGRTCTSARHLKGKRFLDREAPLLPLQQCNSPDCRCNYRHHDDRRQGPRRSDIGLAHDLYQLNGEQERREKQRRGRRKTD